MTPDRHDPDKIDPTDQSGRPLMLSGMILAAVAVLVVLLVIGLVVL